jgi:hypothetical protein
MPRIQARFSPRHTRTPNVPFYYLDVDVVGMEDLGITHIGCMPSVLRTVMLGEDTTPMLVTKSTIISYDPSVIQIGVRLDGATQAIDFVGLAAEFEKTYAESEGHAKRLERNWYVQELTFSHFVKHHRFHKTPVYQASNTRRFNAIAGVGRWFLQVGDVITHPTCAADLAPVEVSV